MSEFVFDDQQAMDELIHGIFAEKASRINNAGAAAQLEFLQEEGWSTEDIEAYLGLQQRKDEFVQAARGNSELCNLAIKNKGGKDDSV